MPICPLCKAKGRDDASSELEPVFAINRNVIQGINPMVPDIRHIQAMLNDGVIVDLGNCPNGHGLIYKGSKKLIE